MGQQARGQGAAPLSTELQLALAPARTFRQLVDARDGGGGAAVLRPMAFSALAFGLTVALVSARWVSVELVATTVASWSFVLVLQAIAAALVILTARRRLVGVGRAFELFFRGHAPWTLWMLGVGAAAIAGQGALQLDAVIVSVLLPVAWTTVIVAAFSRTVLDASRGEAWIRAVAHQVIVWAFGLSYIAWGAGGWIRIVEALAP